VRSPGAIGAIGARRSGAGRRVEHAAPSSQLRAGQTTRDSTANPGVSFNAGGSADTSPISADTPAAWPEPRPQPGSLLSSRQSRSSSISSPGAPKGTLASPQ